MKCKWDRQKIENVSGHLATCNSAQQCIQKRERYGYGQYYFYIIICRILYTFTVDHEQDSHLIGISGQLRTQDNPGWKIMHRPRVCNTVISISFTLCK